MSVLDNVTNPAFYEPGGLAAANPGQAFNLNPLGAFQDNPMGVVNNAFGSIFGNNFADDVLGFDPNGGGIWDQNSGLLGGNFFGGGNPAGGGQSYFDQYGDIDVTAPGGSEGVGTTDLADATRGYIDPSLQAAENIYNAGRPDLNPLLQGYYDTSASLIDQAQGIDPRTQELVQQSIVQANSPFFAAGTPGSARAAYASGQAAAETLLDRQNQARQQLGTIGNQYQDWQTNADWDWLGQFQDAIGRAPTGRQYDERTNRLTGSEIYEKSIGKDLVQKYGPEALFWLKGQGAPGSTGGYTGGYSGGGGGGGGSNPAAGLLGGVVNNVVGDALGGLGDVFGGGASGGFGGLVSSFFNEGGKVEDKDWF